MWVWLLKDILVINSIFVCLKAITKPCVNTTWAGCAIKLLWACFVLFVVSYAFSQGWRSQGNDERLDGWGGFTIRLHVAGDLMTGEYGTPDLHLHFCEGEEFIKKAFEWKRWQREERVSKESSRAISRGFSV